MKKRKMTALLLAVAMVAGVITGCGKGATQGTETNGTQTNGKGEEAPLKYTLSMSNGLNEYIMQSTDINQDKWLKDFDARYNVDVDINLLDHKRFVEEMQMMFASGKIPDVVKCYENYTHPGMCNAVENGVFQSLDEYLVDAEEKYPNLMRTIPKEIWDYNKYEGKIYGIPVVYLSETARRATYIRKDLLDKAGLEVPKNLDETVAVLKAFKDMGLEYPYAGREKWSYTDIFFGAFGVNPTTWNLNENNELVPDIIRPQMKEALTFLHMLNEEGLMDPESLTTTSSDWLNKIYSGKVGMFDHNATQIASFNSSLRQNVPDGEFVLIQSPEGPYGDKGAYKYAPVLESIYFNKNFKYVDRFLKLLDEMCTDEAQDYLSYGIEGENWTKKADGSIEYTYPDSVLGEDETRFRKFLGFIKDDAYDVRLTPYLPGGEELMSWMQNVGPMEGTDNINPGNLESLLTHPELDPKTCDLFYEMSAKIFYGQEPVDTFDKFVEEYKSRGGDQVIKEATEKYEAGNVFYCR
ncbi:extracellular solute-binding protein [Lachnoclostridium phytofermentans]|nr:extracellular solute-binding protein [Lachnoclostridium phytofermentans]